MYKCKVAGSAVLECQKAAQVVFVSHVCKGKLVSWITTINQKHWSVNKSLHFCQGLFFSFCPLMDLLDLTNFSSFFLSNLCWISWSPWKWRWKSLSFSSKLLYVLLEFLLLPTPSTLLFKHEHMPKGWNRI